MTEMFKFSPTGLSVFTSCPRCFWLEKNAKIKRPRGIYPSLPSGMDGKIKTFYDTHRIKGTIPPELAAAVDSSMVNLYADLPKLTKMRNWRSGLKYSGAEYTLGGAIDDLITNVRVLTHCPTYSPYDYKTKGSEPKDTDSVLYYQTQLDCYALLLENNGYPLNGVGYLAYYYPESVGDNGVVVFKTKITLMEVSAKRADAVCKSAVACLKGPIPDPIGTCEYCNYHRTLSAFTAAAAKPFPAVATECQTILESVATECPQVQLELPL